MITTSVRMVGAWPKNCRADRETVEVSNYRAGTSKLSQYRSLEQSYTVLTHGMLEQIEKLSRYRTIEQGLQKLSQYRSLEQSYTVLTHGMLKQIEKLSRYRTIEQGLQNCCNIGHSRPKNCRGIELSSRDLKLSSISSILSRDLKTV